MANGLIPRHSQRPWKWFHKLACDGGRTALMSREYTLQRARTSSSGHIDFAAELHEQQLAAVTASPGPILVIAGAGSGKTRTLQYRGAYLHENGIDTLDMLLLNIMTNDT